MTAKILEWKVAVLLQSLVQIMDYLLFFSNHDTWDSSWLEFFQELKISFLDAWSYMNSHWELWRSYFMFTYLGEDPNLEENGKKKMDFLTLHDSNFIWGSLSPELVLLSTDAFSISPKGNMSQGFFMEDFPHAGRLQEHPNFYELSKKGWKIYSARGLA